MKTLVLFAAVFAILKPTPAEGQRRSRDVTVATTMRTPLEPDNIGIGRPAVNWNDRTDDPLTEGAILGGIIGGVAGAVTFRGFERFAGDDPSTKATVVGSVIGIAAGASVGMLVDHLIK